MFEVGVSPLELFVRGTALYLFLFAVFRVVIKRRIGSVGLADILVVVLIADAAQNGISGEYRSITEAFVVVGTIVGWTVLIDWLCYRVPARSSNRCASTASPIRPRWRRPISSPTGSSP